MRTARGRLAVVYGPRLTAYRGGLSSVVPIWRLGKRVANMHTQELELKNGQALTIREAVPDDACAILAYVEAVSGESDFLSFGPGEFGLSEADERTFLAKCLDAANQIFQIGLADDVVVSVLTFQAGRRSRARHCGEFGLSVRKAYWALGVGSAMMDTLIEWARGTGIVTKINLRVRTDNRRAIRLYGSKGFEIEGTIRRDIRVDGTYFDHHLMGLVL